MRGYLGSSARSGAGGGNGDASGGGSKGGNNRGGNRSNHNKGGDGAKGGNKTRGRRRRPDSEEFGTFTENDIIRKDELEKNKNLPPQRTEEHAGSRTGSTG